MSFTVTGTIKTIQDIQTFDAGSAKVTFQLETKEQYNNKYSFELFKGADHVEHVNNFTKYNKVGDEVTVEFNVNTNEWKDKFFTSLSVWKVEKAGQSTEQPTAEQMGDDSDISGLPF